MIRKAMKAYIGILQRANKGYSSASLETSQAGRRASFVDSLLEVAKPEATDSANALNSSPSGDFAMHENTQRTYTSAGDLQNLDYNAESEYIRFPGEEITIAKGYLSVVKSLASILPAGLIQLHRKVTRIEWQPDGHFPLSMENGHGNTERVMLHFADGSTMSADHVVVTVSLGVLKQGIHQDVGLFKPPLQSFKNQAISKFGYVVVNKLFVQLSSNLDGSGHDAIKFPHLQMVFHQPQWKSSHPKISWWMRRTASTWWMRRTASTAPIYSKANVLLSWFACEKAVDLESLSDEDILDGVSSTVSTFFSNSLCSDKKKCEYCYLREVPRPPRSSFGSQDLLYPKLPCAFFIAGKLSSPATVFPCKLSSPSNKYRWGISRPFSSATSKEIHIDWREMGVLTEVRDQEQHARICACCYAMVAACTVEALWMLKKGVLQSLSVQQLVDCTRRFGNKGCVDGFVDSCYRYMTRFGISSEYNYPYLAKERYSDNYNRKIVAAHVDGYATFQCRCRDFKGYEVAIINALQQQPVAVCLSISMELYNYQGGILEVWTPPPIGSPGHCMVIVGAMVLAGKKVWVVRNSWGKNWGINGYAFISRALTRVFKQVYYPIIY